MILQHVVLGFKSHQNCVGVGSATLLMGPETSSTEQAKLVLEAKHHGKFPKGIGFVQRVAIVPLQFHAIAAPVTK